MTQHVRRFLMVVATLTAVLFAQGNPRLSGFPGSRWDRLAPGEGSRFSMEHRIYSLYKLGDGLGSFTGGYLTTLGYQLNPEFKFDLTLGYRLAQWNPQSSWQWGESLSLSNIKSAAVEWKNPSGLRLRLQYGQDPDAISGFASQFWPRFGDDFFSGATNSFSGPSRLTASLTAPLASDRVKVAISVSADVTRP